MDIIRDEDEEGDDSKKCSVIDFGNDMNKKRNEEVFQTNNEMVQEWE